LGLAREDEAAARALAPLDGIAESIVGFRCQQAVEKALKAALASREVDFPQEP
jgi:HEPN domain-containing protein